MVVDLTKVRSIKEDKTLNKTQTSTSQDILSELKKAITNKERVLINKAIYESCSWIESNDMWINDKQGNLNNTNDYNRRKLVTVDLGAAHLGSEAAFLHPAVVLYEERDWVLIAPITSKKFGKGLDILVDIPKGSCSGLTENSTVQVDHIRAISKRRITGTLPGTMPNPFMDKINKVILEKYIPHVSRNYKKIINDNNRLKTENKQLRDENATLKETIKQYEEQLEKREAK